VLLGAGKPLFGALGIDPVSLDRVDVREAFHATHLRYRVVHRVR